MVLDLAREDAVCRIGGLWSVSGEVSKVGF